MYNIDIYLLFLSELHDINSQFWVYILEGFFLAITSLFQAILKKGQNYEFIITRQNCEM